jgi:hypothetical protein
MSKESHKAHKVAVKQALKVHRKELAYALEHHNGTKAYALMVAAAHRVCGEALKAADAAYKATLKQS